MPIERTRVHRLNAAAERSGDYVLYWMQASLREPLNHALEYAVQRANHHQLRLAVCFGIMDGYPEANLRHYRFMVQGLAEVAAALADRGIRFVLRHGHPADVAIELGRDAAEVVCDRGYLNHQKQWRAQVARKLDCPVAQVETDTVVPLQVISGKAEYAARTIRPKIHRQLQDYLLPLRPEPLEKDSINLSLDSLDAGDVDGVLSRLQLDGAVGPVDPYFVGGHTEARRRLDEFLDDKLNRYAEGRNEPVDNIASGLSPYLHFGQISPLEVALAVRSKPGTRENNKEKFLEELLVRRTLAQNWCDYCPEYDRYSALPQWARATLAEHRDDPRDPVYTAAELEAGETHDPYWNAAMREMKLTGTMHNYMRMYWGKKIIEWTHTPEYAFKVALDLNNRYFLDGRDPNSWTNVGWLFGLHDRPWTERPIFGKVRYMNAKGLERKFDIQAYVDKMNALAG